MINTIHNPGCDGVWCHKDIGEVRVYQPDFILCRSCFAHANAYRRVCGWTHTVEWDTAEYHPLEDI